MLNNDHKYTITLDLISISSTQRAPISTRELTLFTTSFMESISGPRLPNTYLLQKLRTNLRAFNLCHKSKSFLPHISILEKDERTSSEKMLRTPQLVGILKNNQKMI